MSYTFCPDCGAPCAGNICMRCGFDIAEAALYQHARACGAQVRRQRALRTGCRAVFSFQSATFVTVAGVLGMIGLGWSRAHEGLIAMWPVAVLCAFCVAFLTISVLRHPKG